jgi:hypothetical protein
MIVWYEAASALARFFGLVYGAHWTPLILFFINVLRGFHSHCPGFWTHPRIMSIFERTLIVFFEETRQIVRVHVTHTGKEHPACSDYKRVALSPDPSGNVSIRYSNAFDPHDPSAFLQREVIPEYQREMQRNVWSSMSGGQLRVAGKPEDEDDGAYAGWASFEAKQGRTRNARGAGKANGRGDATGGGVVPPGPVPVAPAARPNPVEPVGGAAKATPAKTKTFVEDGVRVFAAGGDAAYPPPDGRLTAAELATAARLSPVTKINGVDIQKCWAHACHGGCSRGEGCRLDHTEPMAPPRDKRIELALSRRILSSQRLRCRLSREC